jgi:hypothetical protein
VAMVVEQDWRPKDLPPLSEALYGDEPVTLFLPGMTLLDAWEFVPWDITAPVMVNFGDGRVLCIPGVN